MPISISFCLLTADSGHCGRRSHPQVPGAAPDHPRRLAQGAQKGVPHALAIGEPRLSGNDVHRMPTLLHQEPARLDSELLDGLGWRASRLGAESAAELARAKMRHSRQFID